MDAEFLSNSWVYVQSTQDVPIEVTQPIMNQPPIEQPKFIKEPPIFRAWFCGANNYVVTLFVQHTREQFGLAPGPTFFDLSFSLPVEKENDNNFNVQAILGIQDTGEMKIAAEKGFPIVEKEDNLNIVVLALCTNNSNNTQSDIHKSIVFKCQELNIPILGVELHSTIAEPTTEFINLQLSLRQLGLPFVTCFVESPESVKKCIKTIYDVGMGNLVVPLVSQIPSIQTTLPNRRKIDCFGMEPNSFTSWEEFTTRATEEHIEMHHRIRLLLCGVENSAKAVEEIRHLMVLHLPDIEINIRRRLAIGVETRTVTEQDLRGECRQAYTYFDLVFLCWSGQTRNIVENYIPFLENLHSLLKQKQKRKKCGIVLTILDKETQPNEIIRPAYLWELNLEDYLDVSSWNSVALSVVTPSISVEHTKIFGTFLTEAITDILEPNSTLDTLAPTRYQDVFTKMQSQPFSVQWQEDKHRSSALCKMEYSRQLGIKLSFTVYDVVEAEEYLKMDFKAKDVALTCDETSQNASKFSFQAQTCVGKMVEVLFLWRNSLPSLSASFTFECADDFLHKAAVKFLQMRATKKRFLIEVLYTYEHRPQNPKQARLQNLAQQPLTRIKQGTTKKL